MYSLITQYILPNLVSMATMIANTFHNKHFGIQHVYVSCFIVK